jgi:hypothetical protein
VYRNHTQWWADYWQSSHVVVTKSRDAATDAPLISLQAAVQRYLSAAEGRGKGIIKFNGGIVRARPPATFPMAPLGVSTFVSHPLASSI